MIYLGNNPVGVALKTGGFARYEKKTLTFPNAKNDNQYLSGAVIPVSFEPKLIICYGGIDSSGWILRGVYYFDDNNPSGGTIYRNSASGNISNTGLQPAVYDSLPTTSANVCRYSRESEKVYITRVNSNGYWSNESEYTFEIYG